MFVLTNVLCCLFAGWKCKIFHFPRICEKLHLTCQVHKNTRAYYIFGGKNERDAGLGIGVVCGEDSCPRSHFPAYLSYSDCRWPKADPERNHFSACVHASLPQATHPEGKAPTCLPAPKPLPLTPSWLLICGGGNMEIVHPPSQRNLFIPLLETSAFGLKSVALKQI